MMHSTFGKNFNITIFGGSHEDMIGCLIRGFPEEALSFDHDKLQHFLNLRAPGNSPLATARKEPDKFEIAKIDEINFLKDSAKLSAGKSDLCLIIRNKDRRSGDYKNLRVVPRPGHADHTARARYGNELNMAGGGPFSARMTAPLCMAGGIALQYLERQGIKIGAHLLCAGDIYDRYFEPMSPEIDEAIAATERTIGKASVVNGSAGSNGSAGANETTGAGHERISSAGARNILPALDASAGEKMAAEIMRAREELDSLGGIVEVAAGGLPAGIGGAMYDGLESLLAPIYFGIPAVKGVEFGVGFSAAHMRGSNNNDAYTVTNGNVTTKTNNAGGILGGITTGMPFIARLAFKPTPSIARQQCSVDLEKMEETTLEIKGRHDPCVAVRAVPIVMAATALGIMDAMLGQ